MTFSFFDDFGIDTALNKGQLMQSPEGFASLTAPLYGCPVWNNGACQGGIPGSQVGFLRNIHPISGTNFVPRMSVGAELVGPDAGPQCALPLLLCLQPSAVE